MTHFHLLSLPMPKLVLGLSGSLADQLQFQIDQASSKVERPGGMHCFFAGIGFEGNNR
jgi:hypothetical protein